MPPIQKETWNKNDFDAWLSNPGNYDHEYVKVLRLSDNELTGLPESIGNLINLERMYLDGNRLTDLPASIGNLTNLKGLFLNTNRLTGLPESIGRLTKLEDLGLGGNQLTSLPESIGNLTNLKTLGLGGNQLTSLPESIGNLTKLILLGLGRNRLTSLPESFGRLTNLTDLYLDGNPSIRISRHLRNRFDIPDNVGIVVENVVSPPVFKNIPRNAENAVMMEPVQDGNNMVNFHGEYDLGRYYKKSTYNSMEYPKKNPFTRRAINSNNLVQYKAKVGGRRKTRKTKKARKTRRSRRN
jgi:hypothetical protein